jgi:hypothetical protein
MGPTTLGTVIPRVPKFATLFINQTRSMYDLAFSLSFNIRYSWTNVDVVLFVGMQMTNGESQIIALAATPTRLRCTKLIDLNLSKGSPHNSDLNNP